MKDLELIVEGAILECTFSKVPAMMLTKRTAKIKDKLAINTKDEIIPPYFVLCNRPSPTPQPCKPQFTADWQPVGKPKVDGNPVLIGKSCRMCAFGGMVKFKESGQFLSLTQSMLLIMGKMNQYMPQNKVIESGKTLFLKVAEDQAQNPFRQLESFLGEANKFLNQAGTELKGYGEGIKTLGELHTMQAMKRPWLNAIPGGTSTGIFYDDIESYYKQGKDIFEYLSDSWEETWKGDYSNKATLLGVVGEVLVGIIPYVGQGADVRDVSSRVVQENYGGATVAGTLGLLPFVGNLRTLNKLKRLTKLNDLGKLNDVKKLKELEELKKFDEAGGFDALKKQQTAKPNKTKPVTTKQAPPPKPKKEKVEKPNKNKQVDGKKPIRTKPSSKPNDSALPKGKPAQINPKMDDVTKRSLELENQAANTLAKNGYDVVQNPPKLPNGKAPDYLIEGKYFDCYSPTSSKSVRGVWSVLKDEKLDAGQADRFVLNLKDWKGDFSVLQQQFKDWPIDKLQEILVIKNDGSIFNLFP